MAHPEPRSGQPPASGSPDRTGDRGPDTPSPASETGADDALRALIARHQTAVWRYLRSLGAAPAAAEELVAETFVVAWQRGVDDRGRAAVAAFLGRTARHLWLRRCRDEGRREELLVEFADRMWQRDCGGDDGARFLAALRECTQELDGRARTAVHLCYGPGAARGDRDRVARTLGMQPNGLKTLLQRVRARLRQCIEQKLGGMA